METEFKIQVCKLLVYYCTAIPQHFELLQISMYLLFYYMCRQNSTSKFMSYILSQNLKGFPTLLSCSAEVQSPLLSYLYHFGDLLTRPEPIHSMKALFCQTPLPLS